MCILEQTTLHGHQFSGPAGAGLDTGLDTLSSDKRVRHSSNKRVGHSSDKRVRHSSDKSKVSRLLPAATVTLSAVACQ